MPACLCIAVWEFIRPTVAPAPASLHRDAFVADEHADNTVELQAYRGESTLEDVDLDDGAA